MCSLLPPLALAQPIQTPLPGASVPKYVEPLLTFAGQRVGGPLVVTTLKETVQKVLPQSVYAPLPAPFNQGTEVWGYDVTGVDVATGLPVSRGPNYPGFTVEAKQGVATTVIYGNGLTSTKLQSLLPVDQTLAWADPKGLGCDLQANPSMDCLKAYTGPVPMVVHLHGSEVPPAFDGGPEAWFTSTGIRGPNYGSLLPVLPNQAMYRYPNTQDAATLWFHDHAFGTTRLNVLGGAAAFYLLRDAQDTGLATNPLKLPSGAQEVEIVMQDRAFDTQGQLLYFDPTQVAQPEVHPLWRPEFFGDVIVVNGKSWPVFDVEPRRYRLRFLDGANARVFQMTLAKAFSPAPIDPAVGVPAGIVVDQAGPVFWQIGTDGGLLDKPVPVQTLLMAPGERADVIVDFSSVAGQTLTLVNNANAPFPGGDYVDPDTTAQIMQFRVKAKASSADTSCNPAATGAAGCTLRPGKPIVRLADAATVSTAAGVKPTVKRQVILREIEGTTGPLTAFLNNTTYSGLRESTLTNGFPGPIADGTGLGPNFVTEVPRVGATEVWEIANLTPDAHPIHIHLIQFQLVARQDLNTGRDDVTGIPTGYLADYLAALPNQTPLPFSLNDAEPPGDGPPKPYNTLNKDGAVGGALPLKRYLVGAARPAEPNERGWKDTIVTYPGTVTRLAIRWAPTTTAVSGVVAGQNLFAFDPTLTDKNRRDAAGNPGAFGYVWHCHILEHEDNEMMRPYAVSP
ncbi:MAG TPA: multicopper oxidase domain-containing protein [Anaeromyxobacteraceae bacterium]|nr:multicopper oxidase domain-containing protein [Anaeromyxobacteraceae bacterium]